MNLMEFLHGIDKDQVIFLGGIMGFFYVGTKEYLLENHEKLNNNLTAYISESIKNAKVRMAGATRRVMNGELDYEEFKANLDGMYARVRNCQKKLESFRPILSRPVVRSFTRALGDGKAIIVTGNEIGRYWFKEEFDNDEEERGW